MREAGHLAAREEGRIGQIRLGHGQFLAAPVGQPVEFVQVEHQPSRQEAPFAAQQEAALRRDGRAVELAAHFLDTPLQRVVDAGEVLRIEDRRHPAGHQPAALVLAGEGIEVAKRSVCRAALQHPGPLALIELRNGEAAPSYVAGTENFYAITRYNWSSYYAMAVIELGQAVAERLPERLAAR